MNPKKLLIVIDYQNDFVCGSLGFEQALALENRIAAKIEEYRQSGGDIAFTFDTHGEDYLSTSEGKNLPVVHCVNGTHGWKLYGKIEAMRRDCDKCFYKPSFGSAELFDYLRDSSYDSVELVGVVTSICVISNAVLAKTALSEAEIIVDSLCTADIDEKLYTSALEVMKKLQIKVIGGV
ncbi:MULTISPECIES: cysteine hydrolase family protein [unclassified Ruminococcus]|uniref:cysteine hydrolase family protein n=1 Tax=unclassified Ruminococcus TaxID=2608920 RepID=UPI00210EF669|nr:MULTISPECIES: isochorismatase family cysteine hydrolase [unclassified Ruminococcus]MCQ4021859.1 isochorismatase family protein [Ruminococcus sp. zg-924]MCQ4114304.1 isochorismatase family protein [Ruminococcus sp. zg-921]